MASASVTLIDSDHGRVICKLDFQPELTDASQAQQLIQQFVEFLGSERMIGSSQADRALETTQ